MSLWDASSWNCLGSVSVPDVQAVAVSADGRRVATATGTWITLWQTPRWRVERRAPYERYKYGLLQFSPDLKTVASQHSDGLCLVDASTGDVAQLLSTNMYAVAFSPDGEFLAGASHTGDWRRPDAWVWRRDTHLPAGHTDDAALPLAE
ncbi:hypothetical protein AB0I60_27005 [Actinosynnema sp. NPDC050436]|uniref:WD40 repeat domain-containing protein n=1 Tax=Actinosynnema sp. NPDC050436 TaxID=3155659 RepID=UPI0033C5D631